MTKQTANLTPFEKLEAHRQKMSVQAKALAAMMDLIDQANETQIQIDRYNDLVASGSLMEAEEEAGITIEALKDMKSINYALQLIAMSFDIEA